jgi:hypothetical protein
MIIHNPILTGSLTLNNVNLSTGNLVTTGSNTFVGNQILSGSLTVSGSVSATGTLTAQTLVVQTVTSSVLYSSGSNIFGNNIANTQVMTGSVTVTGSLAVVTNGTEFQVGATGVNLGNALTDSHVISGSLRVNPNGLFVSGSGNIGMGMVTPLTRLQLQEIGGPSVTPTITLSQDGDLGLDWVAGTVNFYSNDSSANSRGGIAHIRVAAETAYNTGATPSYMAFYTHPNVANNNTIFGAATEKMRITAAGDVGIGVTPATFNVVGPVLQMGRAVFYGYINEAALGANFRYESGDKYINSDFGCLYQMKNGTHVFSTAPSGTAGAAMTLTTRMIITNGGNVGIGTSSPSIYGGWVGLDVRGGNGGHIIVANTADTNRGEIVTDGNGFNITALTNNAMLFKTNNTERMRISSAGITTLAGPTLTTGTQSTYTLQLGESGFAHLTLSYKASTAGYIQTWQSTPLYLNTLGNAVFAGTQRIDNNSDERIKENIISIENALDTVLNLQGRKFNMLDENDKLRYGFVAQEVQPHLGDFVTESDRSFEKDNIKIENLLTLETSGAAWAALLVEAIKELKAEFDEYKTTHP